MQQVISYSQLRIEVIEKAGEYIDVNNTENIVIDKIKEGFEEIL